MNYRIVSQRDIVLIARQPVGLNQKNSTLSKEQFKLIKAFVEKLSEQNLITRKAKNE